MSIKIASGWSNLGGSTIAHINLCNLLNANGYDCTFYGPQPWHLDKCKGGLLNSIILSPEDIVIIHFLNSERPPIKRFILSCHETELFPLKKLGYEKYDAIHFVSDFQKNWHNVKHDNIHVISNVIANLIPSKNVGKTGAAAVIGSIDKNKQVHESVKRALAAGYKKVKIFGLISDMEYFTKQIAPIMIANSPIIEVCGPKAQQEIYDNIDEVFHSSKIETFNYVKAECDKTGVKYNGIDSADPKPKILTSEEILRSWKKLLD